MTAPTPAPTSTEAAVTVPDPSLAEGRTWTGDLTLNDVVLATAALNHRGVRGQDRRLPQPYASLGAWRN